MLPDFGALPRRSAALDNIAKASKIKDWLFEAIDQLQSQDNFEKSPFRCVILRAHYSWSSTILLLLFFLSVSTWYGEEPIRCIDHHDRTPAPPEILDICIQFPYTQKNRLNPMFEERHYALYYVWAHWTSLFMFLMFKIVHVAIYVVENKPFRAVVKQLERTHNYDHRSAIVTEYFQLNYGCHRAMIRKVVSLHVLAFLINLAVFFGIDLALERNYSTLPLFLLVKRDLVFFDDVYSLLFPPFVTCEISPTLHILEGRTSYYGCHLPLMEIYEKFFMGFWFWQVGLAFFTFISFGYWLNLLCSCSTSKDLLDDGSFKKYKQTKKSAKSLNRDEALAISVIKPFLFGPQYRAFLNALVTWEPNEEPLKQVHHSRRAVMPGILIQSKLLKRIEEPEDTLETLFSNITDPAYPSTSNAHDTISTISDPPIGWNCPSLNRSFKPLLSPIIKKPHPSAPTQSTTSSLFSQSQYFDVEEP